MEVRGHVAILSSLPCRSQVVNAGRQAWQQVPLLADRVPLLYLETVFVYLGFVCLFW